MLAVYVGNRKKLSFLLLIDAMTEKIFNAIVLAIMALFGIIHEILKGL